MTLNIEMKPPYYRGFNSIFRVLWLSTSCGLGILCAHREGVAGVALVACWCSLVLGILDLRLKIPHDRRPGVDPLVLAGTREGGLPVACFVQEVEDGQISSAGLSSIS